MNIHLGRVWNIPVRLHASWFLIFGLITWSLASGYLPNEYPNMAPLTYWMVGAATSILFAASVLLHELGHVYLAIRNSVPVRSVTLYLFGGAAELQQEPKSPGAEFRIAIAGPAMSLLLAVFFAILWRLDQTIPFLAAPSEYLMRINFLLAVFNLIPGFPLDGGRVLRAMVWKLTDSARKATRFASTSGQVVAFGFIAFGFLTLLQGNFFNGLWLAFIGWFLQNAAYNAYAQFTFEQSLAGTRVSQVMKQNFEQVSSLLTLDQLVEQRILGSDRQVFLVGDDDRMEGVLTLREVAAVPRRKWPFTTTRHAMIPLKHIVWLTPEMELFNALQQMEKINAAEVPVGSQDRVVGTLSREDVLRYSQKRNELGF